jgi:hypothetical protein
MRLFRKKNVTPHSRAIKDLRLVNMQLAPFSQFNTIVTHDCALMISKAAYQAFVQLPGESKKDAAVLPYLRWKNLFVSFAEAFQGRTDGSFEGIFDVSVTMPDGFHIARSVKVVAVAKFEGKDGFIFMMPDETWPE